MSYESQNPNIKLSVHESWFNLLLTVLTENTKSVPFPNMVESANALIEKLMKYSRPFIDNNDAECVDMRFFPNQAGEMIWQLLIGCGNFLEASEDFYSQLKENRISKEKKSQPSAPKKIEPER